jgi:transcriptional regulator with XRE-family HTH domain
MARNFGELLRKIREGAHISLGNLARHLKVSVTYLSDVERGNRAPLTNERIFDVALYLHIEPDELLEVAAENRGFYELDAAMLSEKGREVGRTLMRGWPSYTDSEFEKIEQLLRDLEAMEKNRRGKI